MAFMPKNEPSLLNMLILARYVPVFYVNIVGDMKKV